MNPRRSGQAARSGVAVPRRGFSGPGGRFGPALRHERVKVGGTESSAERAYSRPPTASPAAAALRRGPVTSPGGSSGATLTAVRPHTAAKPAIRRRAHPAACAAAVRFNILQPSLHAPHLEPACAMESVGGEPRRARLPRSRIKSRRRQSAILLAICQPQNPTGLMMSTFLKPGGVSTANLHNYIHPVVNVRQRIDCLP